MGFFGQLYSMLKKNNEDAAKYREEQKAKTQPATATAMKKGGMVMKEKEKKPKKLVKGSKEAKEYMAKIRSMKK